jgi:hypothetical protein
MLPRAGGLLGAGPGLINSTDPALISSIAATSQIMGTLRAAARLREG